MRKRVLAALVVAAVVAAGCGSGGWGRNADDCVKPTIAVMKFENRAPFPMGWNLGSGMRDILVDRLMATERYHVVERAELGAVIQELQLQQGNVTRPQGRAEIGRIRNCRYLVKGTVTDFGHVSTASGAWGGWNWDIFGGSNRAVMGIILYVVDVESGEIIACESLEESVRAKDLSVQATYQGVSFGGQVFHQTPLGRATAKVIGKAVKRITRAIAEQPWQPQIALVGTGGVIVINGGRDRGVKPGAEFEVLETGAPIVDPATGDVLGHSQGRRVGRVIVESVAARYCVATVVVGAKTDFCVGQACRACG
ncbi:MAG TPA: CsgG/HfaB family protein [Phycisphaerae bacterium]|nr:CsgG/HfaB family protein [Phycisphaerae bacterium]